MSKVQIVKAWLCVGVLFAFLSGGTISWFLNQSLHRLWAVPPVPEASEEWATRFAREMGLDESQAGKLEEILGAWEEARRELQQQFRERFKELNDTFDEKIRSLLTPGQLRRYDEEGI